MDVLRHLSALWRLPFIVAGRLLQTTLLMGLFLPQIQASVDDGQGTNHVGILQAESINIAGTTWTNFPSRIETAGGGPYNFRDGSNVVFWTPVVYASGQLQTARVQTDQGTADVNIVRSQWNDTWGTYSVVGSFQATSSGTASTTWSSSWVSNAYRLGIVVTNFTTGTNLWWSVEYSQ